ncbi:hypothetical protein [Pediococcus ethanolidurans]|nr:hypothetical protein [Pediococcus ethanolidurans]GEN94140.1 hypothetical protein PET01_01900 [Pediococcus ethanolidurans]SER06461.1 hypothetical protein SAMN04487973_101192 [Pediococcus ethanolidurans]
MGKIKSYFQKMSVLKRKWQWYRIEFREPVKFNPKNYLSLRVLGRWWKDPDKNVYILAVPGSAKIQNADQVQEIIKNVLKTQKYSQKDYLITHVPNVPYTYAPF